MAGREDADIAVAMSLSLAPAHATPLRGQIQATLATSSEPLRLSPARRREDAVTTRNVQLRRGGISKPPEGVTGLGNSIRARGLQSDPSSFHSSTVLHWSDVSIHR